MIAAAAPTTPDALADHVHELLLELDPARFRDHAVERCRAALAAAYDGGMAMLAEWSADPAAADPKLVRAVDGLVRAIPEPESVVDWRAVHAALWRPYEALAAALRAEGVPAPRLHPTNWTRSAIHLGIGAGVVLLFELLLTPRVALGLAAAWAGWAWSLEISRRIWPRVNELCMRAFGSIAREHERTRVNSATWMGSAILALALTVPDWRGLLGLLAIAVGDPVAGTIGRRWGRTKGLHGRSLEGSFAFAAATWIVGLAYLRAFHPELGWGLTLASVGVAGVVGAIVEHVTMGIDDNLAVPLAVAAAVTAVGAVQ